MYGTVTPAVTRFDCPREIADTFRRIKDGKPRVFTVLRPHLAARRLREFVFNSLKSRESRGKRIITCSLEFDGFDSVSGKSRGRQLGISAAPASAPAAAAEEAVQQIAGDENRRGPGKQEAKFAKS
jgi:hypothetical protein